MCVVLGDFELLLVVASPQSSLTFRATDQCRVQGFKTINLSIHIFYPPHFLFSHFIPVDCSEASDLCE